MDMEDMDERGELWLPPEQPKQPPEKDRYMPFEARDDESREMARKGVGLLFKAMKLHRGGGIRLPGDESYEAKLAFYEFVSTMVIGEVLEQEVLC